MQHSDVPRKELELAGKSISALGESTDIGASEAHWNEFLNRLERVWYKSTAHFGKSPKWVGWHGPFAMQRNLDPLLRYLTFARGADFHSVEEHVRKVPPTWGFEPEKPMLVGNIMRDLSVVPSIVQFNRITDVPAKLELRPVTHCGVTYAVPTTCCGMPIDPGNVVELGKLAIAYYDDFLQQAERKFVK
jgi:hypothetical protein